ncbi:response regulator transcription factor [Chloroflexota bacterium]
MEKKAHILVVDDDEEFVLRLVKRILEPEGYIVSVATNGKSALSALDESMPNLVLLDIRMPDFNGYQVLERIREKSDVPVIMLTAVREVTSLDKSIGLGADDYIIKPFRPWDLLSRVQAKLRRAGL